MLRGNQKCVVMNTEKRIVKTNQDIFGELCIRNDDSLFAISDEDNKVAQKIYYERFSSTYTVVSEVHCLKDKIMVKKLICKMKNAKGVRSSGVLSEMVKSTGETVIDMIMER